MQRTRFSSDRAIDQRDALLALSRSLAHARQGGVLSDGLDLVLRAMGVERGCAYVVAGDSMDIVAQRGLPAALRHHLDHLALEPAWFIAQAAAAKRAPVVEAVLPSKRLLDSAAHADAFADGLATAGWKSAVAVPLLAGRGVIAVLVAAAPTADPFGAESVAFFETACNMLALGLAREHKPEGQLRDRGGDVKTAQMAALGMLAAGFANDLRGPLEALGFLLDDERTLLASLPVDGARRGTHEELAALVGEASAAVARAQQVTTRLLAAVRESTPEGIDLAELARDVLGLLSSQLQARGIAVETTIDGGVGVFGRREELTQLLMGLLLNAADATHGAHDKRISLRVERDGARVVISVGDSGGGVPPNLRARIFEPFFTTKKEALGLGLTLARHAVVAHRGHIELAASPLGGALFRILLPAAAGPVVDAAGSLRLSSERPPTSISTIKRLATPVDVPRLEGPPKSARLKLLWIDDDDLFLRSIKRAFPDFEVQMAMTADEAEAALAAMGASPPARIFCDIGLPGRSGSELHARLVKSHPALARLFVFVTGGVITPEVADYVIASGCPTLLKPVGRDEILTTLERRSAAQDESPASAPTLREAPTVPPVRRG